LGLGCVKKLGCVEGEFSKFVRFEVGDGSKVWFWHDVWCEDHTLKEAFLMLFAIACFMEALVADLVQLSNNSQQWNVSFIRAVDDWEVELVTWLFNLLYSLSLGRGGKNRMCWIPSKYKGSRSNCSP
jgi:hypothetical protein